MSTIDEAELKAMLARAGLPHSDEQVRAIMPGAEIVQRLLARVNTPLPPRCAAWCRWRSKP